MSTKTLSKTHYLSYLACPEEFWMSLYQGKLMPSFSLDAQHKVEQGNIIDRLAQDWFRSTKLLNDLGINFNQVEFQHQVEPENFIVKADVTVFHGEKICDIYEVKAATGLKSVHIDDIAFQRMVYEKEGYQVRRTFLVHVNSKYPFQAPPNLDEFLQITEVTQEVEALMVNTRSLAQEALNWVQKDSLPQLSSISTTCGNGLNCSYIKHYHPPIPDYTIFDISRLHKNKKKCLLEMDVLNIKDVPLDFQLSKKQRLQVDLVQQNQALIKSQEIKEVLEGLAYPLYFLDYETFSYVFPSHEGIFPYQQMVFQYSLHVIEYEGGGVQHFEYLMPSKDTPLEELFAQMSQQIHPSAGTVIVWNESFEKTQNRLMANRLPKYAEFLTSVNERVYDLMKIFSKGLYLHPKFKGSASIKKVLPVLCPELSYGDLQIQNGNAAVIQWHHMTDGRMTEQETKETYKALLKYCHLDTWAMVRIWEELRKL